MEHEIEYLHALLRLYKNKYEGAPLSTYHFEDFYEYLSETNNLGTLNKFNITNSKELFQKLNWIESIKQ